MTFYFCWTLLYAIFDFTLFYMKNLMQHYQHMCGDYELPRGINHEDESSRLPRNVCKNLPDYSNFHYQVPIRTL